MPEKILVVDDDVDTLRLVGLMLQRQGYQIVAASNGQQALSMAANERPDLIILDLMMPDMDGYEVTRRLRASPVTSSTPVIMFTAKSQVDDKVAGFEAGVDAYLTKPTQPRELFAQVKAVLARSNKSRPAAAPEAPARDRGFVIGIVAARGGLGCSTMALNLGITLRQRTKKEVIIAEFRPGEGSMALEMGYLHPEGFDRLLQRKAPEISPTEVAAELITHKSDVRLLMSSYKPSDAKHQVSADKFEAIARHLVYLSNYIIIDAGPGISPIQDKVLPLCDELVVLLEPLPYTILRTQTLIDELVGRGFGEGRISVVLYNRQRTELQMSLANLQQQFKYPISVVFTPAPELAYQAARSNVPLVVQHPDQLITQQFNKLAENVLKHTRVKV